MGAYKDCRCETQGDRGEMSSQPGPCDSARRDEVRNRPTLDRNS